MKNLPIVPDKLIVEFGNEKINFQALYNNLKETNPDLLKYIIDLPNYLAEQGKPITRGILVHLGLSICELISRANDKAAD